jgi:hypothetical protein
MSDANFSEGPMADIHFVSTRLGAPSLLNWPSGMTGLLPTERFPAEEKRAMSDRQAHWEHVYATKDQNAVSWFQEKPDISLDLVRATGVSATASIIGIGGGAKRSCPPSIILEACYGR